jgi:predicted helicase
VSISDEGVHVLDPFCGTGTFIVRLLQSGIIKPEDLARKYNRELHSNEYLLLAYYIAAINIESTYHSVAVDLFEQHAYEPFDGVVLTDTFQLGESGDGTGSMDVFPVNNERAAHQKMVDIRVIIGNPPYSIAQTSQNDNNQNLAYPTTDRSISETYAARTDATLKRSLYDSYVRAFRWSSDRILHDDRGGVIAFVTNGSFIEANSFDGFRKSIASEFHHIYCYNLRGNTRTAGEQARREGGQTFGAGSRATVAITILVKEPGPLPPDGAVIHYRDIGDYLSREQKLEIISSAATETALDSVDWDLVVPNEHGDWINQRSNDYDTFTALSSQSGESDSIFGTHTSGILSSRDAWNFNFSRQAVAENAQRMIDFYNSQLEEFNRSEAGRSTQKSQRVEGIKDFACRDPKQFSWDRADFDRIARGISYEFRESSIRTATYRPFVRAYVNFDKDLNNARYKQPDIFPDATSENVVIAVTGNGADSPLAALAIREIGEYHLLGTDTYYPRFIANSKTFENNPSLFNVGDSTGLSDNIPMRTRQSFTQQYGRNVSGDEIFAYTYGMLYSPAFTNNYSGDLSKTTHRIPVVPDVKIFELLVDSGQALLDLHLNYESTEPWPDLEISYSPSWNSKSKGAYKVEKMRYAKSGASTDRTTVIFNSGITISGIPIEAHDYRLGSRSALDCVIERYQIKTDKASGIVNNPNDWAAEHDDPTYIFDLVRRIVTVSMRTNEIVSGLPTKSF